MQDSNEGARLKFEIMAEIPQADLFHRDHSADWHNAHPHFTW